MRNKYKIYSLGLASTVLLLFILLFSSVAAADSICGSDWTWSGGDPFCPTCCRDLGNGIAQCQHSLCVSSTPKQISPNNGSVFSEYPRTTTLKWNKVSRAASYSLEVQYGDPDYKWWALAIRKTGIKTTSYTFDFVGAQPGRWRVWAVATNGYKSEKSSWRYFRYTR
jgi:hypothetical protein